jgi:hypothetical protein
MKITRLRVTNYRGIEALDECIGDAGAVVKGPNGAGKTSVLKAIRAALAGRDIGADAIRLGASKAEILVDLGDKSVRRLITAKTSTLTVEQDGHKLSAPQSLLMELLGTSPLDPIELYEADAKRRKAIILRAMPAKLSRAAALEIIPPAIRPAAEAINYDAHGLEVAEQLATLVYNARKDINAQAKAAEARATELYVPDAALEAPAVGEADAKLSEAEKALGQLESEAKRFEESGAKAEEMRKRIDGMRAESGALHAALHVWDDLEALANGSHENAAVNELEQLERKVVAARARLAEVQADMAKLAKAKELTSMANTLESGLASAHGTPMDPAKLAKAKAARDEAKALVERARAADKAREQRARHEEASNLATRLQADSAELTAILDRLRKDIPNELLANADGISGLSVDGDKVLLDGVDIVERCGQEQLGFAVEIARRLNAKSKILVVDGLERLDEEQMRRFVADATRDDYQLIGTRVDAGEVVFEAIEAVEEDDDAPL